MNIFHTISYHIILCYNILHHMISNWILYIIILSHIIFYRIISYYIRSCHIIQDYIISYKGCTVLYRVISSHCSLAILWQFLCLFSNSSIFLFPSSCDSFSIYIVVLDAIMYLGGITSTALFYSYSYLIRNLSFFLVYVLLFHLILYRSSRNSKYGMFNEKLLAIN